MDSPRSYSKVSKRFQVISEHLYSDLMSEAVVLSLVTGKYYGLNRVGTRIWRVLLEPSAASDIEAVLMGEFNVDRDTCSREVSVFLDSMLKEKLITVVDDQGN